MLSRTGEIYALRSVDRRHRLLEYLYARAPRRVTGEDLATTLEVSVRTVERDVADLVAAGIPVAARRGRDGGYAVAEPGRGLVLELQTGELAAVVASLVGVGPYASATARSVLDKCRAALDRSYEKGWD